MVNYCKRKFPVERLTLAKKMFVNFSFVKMCVCVCIFDTSNKKSLFLRKTVRPQIGCWFPSGKTPSENMEIVEDFACEAKTLGIIRRFRFFISSCFFVVFHSFSLCQIFVFLFFSFLFFSFLFFSFLFFSFLFFSFLFFSFLFFSFLFFSFLFFSFLFFSFLFFSFLFFSFLFFSFLFFSFLEVSCSFLFLLHFIASIRMRVQLQMFPP